MDRHGDAPDLHATMQEGWERVRNQVEANPLARLAVTAHSRLDRIVDRSVDRIWEAIPTYQGTVPTDDLWWSVYRNDQSFLLLLAEGRRLDADELDVRAKLGARRAAQGLPVTDLLRAFRIGYAVLWDALVETGAELGTEATAALLANAALAWTALDEVSSAVAERYRAIGSARNVDARRRSIQLLDGLRNLPSERELTEGLARSLGLDPNDAFVVAVHDGHLPRPTESGEVVVEEPDRSIVVTLAVGSPEATEHALSMRLLALDARHVGVGLARESLDGAAASLLDAERAHKAAVSLNVSAMTWRGGWFEALVVPACSSLVALVRDAVSLLSHDDEQRKTVVAFLKADGSLTTAGDLLHLRPNSVGYRIKRFADATGLDLHTTSGVHLAKLTLILARYETSNAKLDRSAPG